MNREEIIRLLAEDRLFQEIAADFLTAEERRFNDFIIFVEAEKARRRTTEIDGEITALERKIEELRTEQEDLR